MHAHDWATTPLGPPEAWPSALRAAVDLIPPYPLGMIVLWGPDLLQIYNDGYRDVIGGEAPGRPGPGHAPWR